MAGEAKKTDGTKIALIVACFVLLAAAVYTTIEWATLKGTFKKWYDSLSEANKALVPDDVKKKFGIATVK